MTRSILAASTAIAIGLATLAAPAFAATGGNTMQAGSAAEATAKAGTPGAKSNTMMMHKKHVKHVKAAKHHKKKMMTPATDTTTGAKPTKPAAKSS